MTFGARPDRDQALALLDRVGLSHRLDHYPRQLSSGQQQRVAVARALAKRPKLVLADEPTGNLDHRNARETLKLVREACLETGAALLLVSHDSEALASFENVRDFAALNRVPGGGPVSDAAPHRPAQPAPARVFHHHHRTRHRARRRSVDVGLGGEGAVAADLHSR